MRYADLHLHTTNSDGILTPQELIDEARSAEIQTLAITDHNKLLLDFEELKEQNPDMNLVRGVEITALHEFSTGKKTEIHIVGLLFKEIESMVSFLGKNHSDGRKRVTASLKRLKEDCKEAVGTYEDIQKMFPGERIGRMQLAKAMVAWGITKNVTDSFDIYIGDYGKRLAWVENPVKFASIQQVVDAIKEAKGIAVLAHPLSYKLNDEEFQELIECFKSAGGHALEAAYLKYDSIERAFLENIAKEKRFLVSCGTDYHGNFEGEELKGHFSIEYFLEIEKLQNRLYPEE